MANHLSVRLLNGENIKVIVPENSHMYRDEADGLYSVHRKRLIPVGKGKPYFELEDLKETLDYLKSGETFDSGTGTVVIENPVRRADGKYVPIETIKEISEYCREKGYKLHLDGARIHLASAYTNTPISEYSSYFDTVYISLYKCLNTAGGAVLCGDSELIDMVPYQIKIHGGTVFQSWSNTAMAFHYLKDIESKWKFKAYKEFNEKLDKNLNKDLFYNIMCLVYHRDSQLVIDIDNVSMRYEKALELLNIKPDKSNKYEKGIQDLLEYKNLPALKMIYRFCSVIGDLRFKTFEPMLSEVTYIHRQLSEAMQRQSKNIQT